MKHTSHKPRSFEQIGVEALRKAGYRITQQRKAVLTCIAEATEPLSAPKLYEALEKRADGSPVDRVSVYRVLDTLLELHLVHRVQPNGLYVACTHHQCTTSFHVMTRCTECQTVKEQHVPHEVVAPLLFHMTQTLAFTPDTHLLHIDGVCSRCSTK
jgi:Fe2+ or Zn2+ uptake regulation protein